MADNEYKIVFGADVDKKSIDNAIHIAEKEAVKECAKLKPVKLSVKASTSFEAKDTNNKKEVSKIKKLNEAQLKLINHYNQQFKKGFKSSPEYMAQRKSLYNNYKELAKGRSKTTQDKEITRVIGGSIRDYNKEIDKQLGKTLHLTMNDIDKALKAWSNEFQAKIKSAGEKRARELADKKFFEDLNKSKSGRKARALRTSNLDDTYFGVEDEKGNKPLLRKNDKLGTYFGRNSLMRQWAEYQTIARKKAKESLQTYKVTGYKTLGKNFDNRYTYKDAASKNVDYANIAKVGGQLMGKTPDVTVDDLAKIISKTMTEELVASDFQNIQPAFTKAVNGAIAELMNRFKDGGILGVRYGDEGTYKGEGVNLERWNSAMKQVLDGFSKIDISQLQQQFDQVRTSLTNVLQDLSSQENRATTKIKEFEKQIEENTKRLGIEFRTRESLDKALTTEKAKMKENQAQLKELNKQYKEARTRLNAAKPDYRKGEKEYKASYYESDRKAYALLKELEAAEKAGKPKSEIAELRNKRNVALQEHYNNPYMSLIKAYNDAGDDMAKISAPMKELEASISRSKSLIDGYEQEIAKITNLTKDEQNQRKENIKQLKDQNDQLKLSVKELNSLKSSLGEQKKEAKKALYNATNYTPIENVLRQSLSPLINYSFTGDQKDLDKLEGLTEKQINTQRIAESREGVSDKTLTNIEKVDANDGFNAEENARQVIESLNSIKALMTSMLMNDNKDSYNSILTEISNSLKSISATVDTMKTDGITTKGNNKNKSSVQEAMTTALSTIVKDQWLQKNQLGEDAWGRKVVYGGRERKTEAYDRDTEDFRPTIKFGIKDEETERKRYKRALNKRYSHNQFNFDSSIYASLKDPAKWSIRLKDAFADLIGVTTKYKQVLFATSKEQDQMSAEAVEKYGQSQGRDYLGDKAAFARRVSMWKGNDSKFEDFFKGLKLTEGVDIDTTAITDKMSKLLSGSAWRNAQMGGSPLRNLIGYGTGFIGMPSLEKSRATADAMNQINANIRESMDSILDDIQTKESALRGLRESGDLKTDEKGRILDNSTAEAKTLVVQLENAKLILATVLADMEKVNGVIKKSPNNIGKVVKQLNFTSPVLRKNNDIVRNIAAGYDKNGKALKFQSRIAEILNYTFQLMGRHIGQMLKNWALMLNPLNLIKKAFNDFMSYDIKWQRTMNVIKYNLRAIIKPFMEWIAQSLVNVIGFLDIISQRIQKAFGKIPISLFDQMSADAEKTAEEIQNVSAGFDELHDIGSDSSGANDLFGEIYKPQLSKEWEDLATRIGDLFGNLFTGKTTLMDFLKEAGTIIWDFLKLLCKDIGKWIDSTLGPKIKEEFMKLLDTLLKIFLGWELLKIAGKLLWNAFFGSFSAGSGTSVLKSLFTDKNGVVGIGQNIGTLIAGGIITVISAMALKDAINSAWETGGKDAVTGKDLNLNDKQTNMDALKGALGGAGVVVGGGMIAAALGASVALGPLVAVAAGVAALAAVVVVAAEAWNYHAKQNKIANNEMLEAADYAAQAEDAQNRLNEVNEVANSALKTKNTNQEKLNQLQNEYGMSLGWVTEKVRRAGGDTSVLTEREKELYDQGIKTQKSIENYNKLLELQIKLTNETMWKKEEEAIKLDMEAKNYEMAMLRIEQAELEGTITTEEATKKRIQLYKECGETERYELLQNLTPEQRTLMAQYTNATEEELGKLARIWDTSSEATRNALLDGVGPDVQDEYRRRLNAIDDEVKKHQGFWQGVGDTLKEVFTFGQASTWTYNGETKYYEEGYGRNYKQQRKQELETTISQIERNPLMSEQEKKKQIQELRNRIASLDVGTNYVPNDGLAYLHQGEAVIPKKYNQPYQQGMSNEERAYMQQLMSTMRSLDGTMKQGISVNGQFTQRGSDLVAVVNKTNSQTGADLLSNVSYAR